MVPAGKRRTRVTFERPVAVDDGGGGQTITWVEIGQEFVYVERLRSLTRDVERVQDGGRVAIPMVRLHVLAGPTMATVSPADRAVTAGGEIFSLSKIQPSDETDRILVMSAEITGRV